MEKRLQALLVMMVLIFAGLGLHIGMVGSTKASLEIQSAGAAQGQRRYTVAQSRGTIYDRNGVPLTNTRYLYRTVVLPTRIAPVQLLRPYCSGHAFLSLIQTLKAGLPAWLDMEKAFPIQPGLEQFLIPVHTDREALAVHLIGYLQPDGMHGAVGLEKGYDDLLSGYSGKAVLRYPVNGTGEYMPDKPVKRENSLSSCRGGLRLTLDSGLQKLAESLPIRQGAVMVCDREGRLLAGASFPAFDPTAIDGYMARTDAPLLNRLLAGFDCGSVFKIITAAAALEQGISPYYELPCEGKLLVGNRAFHCHHRLGHGKLTMMEAFSQSCNLYFIQLAQMIGPRAILDTASKFGLAEPLTLGNGLVAPACILPAETELLVPAALANLSFGQGRLLVSPAHIAQMIGTIANNGCLVQPRIIEGTVDEKGVFKPMEMPDDSRAGERVLSPHTTMWLRRMLQAVVTDGTGRKAALNGITAAGKTGTAQTGQKKDGKPVDHSWFTGYFPAESPQFSVTVLVENHCSGDKSAAELFCEFSNKLIEKGYYTPKMP